jgi:hypothetical protein
MKVNDCGCFRKMILAGIYILGIAGILASAGGLPSDYVTFGGQVSLQDGSPLEGIEVEFFMPDPPNINSDGKWTVLTDENGMYSDFLFTFWSDRSFSITPSHPAYIFSPTNYSFPGAYEDHLDLDFTATPVN